jgi:colanic acid/amylovoran biosynthesis glycosyltransferase
MADWKVAYMVSAYPARSHTFIKREIVELEKNGPPVVRYSQRRCDVNEIIGEAERQEFQVTWSIFSLPYYTLIYSIFNSFLANPIRFFSTFTWVIVRRPKGLKGCFYAVMYFLQGMILARKMRQDKVNFLHIHFVNSGVFVGSCAAKYLGIGWGVSVHGRSDFDYPGIETMIWVIKDAAFLRCISAFGAAQAKRQVAREYWDKIFVAYCGLPDKIIPERLAQKPSALDFQILSVGRLSPEKGNYVLLDMAEQLKNHRHSFQVNIVGDGPGRTTLEKDLEEKSLGDVCRMSGAVSEAEVLALMKDADVFVCSSLMEGLPLVILEAMAVGCPVVAPYLSGIPEAVTPGETGLLYPVGDSKAMTDAVEQLICDEALGNHLATAAHRRVLDKFAMSDTIRPLLLHLRSGSLG